MSNWYVGQVFKNSVGCNKVVIAVYDNYALLEDSRPDDDEKLYIVCKDSISCQIYANIDFQKVQDWIFKNIKS